MALRYVILRHEGVPEPHFDLMFETAEGSALATWRSPAWPPASETVEKLPDHRREYLDYEGPVSHDRGYVKQVEAGTYERLRESDPSIVAFKLHAERDRVLSLRRVSELGWVSSLREAE
jgi:hypothetical protein